MTEPANPTEAILPPVPMVEHLKVVHAHMSVSQKYNKAVGIIDLLKQQVGTISGNFAEVQVDLHTMTAERDALNARTVELEKRAVLAETEREQIRQHAEALARKLAEADRAKE